MNKKIEKYNKAKRANRLKDSLLKTCIAGVIGFLLGGCGSYTASVLMAGSFVGVSGVLAGLLMGVEIALIFMICTWLVCIVAYQLGFDQ